MFLLFGFFSFSFSKVISFNLLHPLFILLAVFSFYFYVFFKKSESDIGERSHSDLWIQTSKWNLITFTGLRSINSFNFFSYYTNFDFHVNLLSLLLFPPFHEIQIVKFNSQVLHFHFNLYRMTSLRVSTSFSFNIFWI